MEPLEDVLKKVEDLKRDLSASEKGLSYKEEGTGEYEGRSYLQLGEPREITRQVLVEDGTWIPDTTTRKRARQSLRDMYKHLPNINHRKIVGKALGYSDLRIWAHEHPVLAILVGIATAGAASGLEHIFYQHLTK